MKTSQEINGIAKALSSAQASMTGAKKDATNPFFKSNYSDLTAVMSAISKPFADNDLSFVQAAEEDNGMIAVSTRIMHSSGQWIESTTKLPAVKHDPQAYGSAITYAKRYGLQALAGVPSVDDDAQYACATMQNKQQATLKQVIDGIDEPGFLEFWHSMDTSDKKMVWGLLDDTRRQAIKNKIDTEKEAA